MMPTVIHQLVSQKTLASNEILVQLERRALNFTLVGNTTEATRIMTSSLYQYHKNVYAEGISAMTSYILNAYANAEQMQTALFAGIQIICVLLV